MPDIDDLGLPTAFVPYLRAAKHQAPKETAALVSEFIGKLGDLISRTQGGNAPKD